MALVYTDEKAHSDRPLIFGALSALSVRGHHFLLANWYRHFWCLDGHVYSLLRNGWAKFWQHRNGYWNDWFYRNARYEYWYDWIINAKLEFWYGRIIDVWNDPWNDWIVKLKPDNVGIVRDESHGFVAVVSPCGIVCGKSS